MLFVSPVDIIPIGLLFLTAALVNFALCFFPGNLRSFDWALRGDLLSEGCTPDPDPNNPLPDPQVCACG